MDYVKAALEAGFLHANVIPAADIPFEGSFRSYCEENLCGQYGANYSCPPTCGTPEQMRQRMLEKKQALVMQSVWEIPDYRDRERTRQAQHQHNTAMLDLMEKIRSEGRDCLMAGASCCSLCSPCAMAQGEPCRYPESRFSCLSAYCIFVKELAERCEMEYVCAPGKVTFFGMILFD